MIIKIDKNEVNAVKYACGLCDYKVSFYTIEVNDKLVTVVILDQDGNEPSAEMVWHLARQTEAKLAIEAFARK